jgi:hypothetical protein
MTLLALALGAVSLTYPSTPSYDPWSWLIWGREIFHAITSTGPVTERALHIAGGSSWKPLPVIFTTVLAIFGSAQPNLWLIVARAGAVMSVLVSVKLSVRITWNLVARGRETGWFEQLGLGGRIGAIAPPLFAGLIALVGVGFTPTYPVNMLLGYSEGLAFAVALIAAERAWDGHHRQAFALGIVPALDRPEFWVIWGPYGLWVLWKDRGAWKVVIGVGVLMLLLWLVPQKLGGGSLHSLVTHPKTNHSRHSAVNSSFPFWHELSRVIWPLALERVEVMALLQMAATAFLVWRGRQAGWLAALRTHAAAVAAAVAGALGFLWWLGISVETQAGFAGNSRYAILGVMLVYVGGCVGYGWACLELARLADAIMSRFTRRRLAWGASTVAATAVMALVFLFIPGWFAHRLPTINSVRYAVRYQARLREQVASLIQREGGPAKVMGCGSVMTNNLQVTMVAWYLNVPIPWVQAVPKNAQTVPGPNVVLQDGDTATAPQSPSLPQMQAWEQGWQHKNGSQYKIVTTHPPVTMYMNCSVYSPS